MARRLKPIQYQYDLDSYHYHVITVLLHPGITFSVSIISVFFCLFFVFFLFFFFGVGGLPDAPVRQKTGVLERATKDCMT